MLNLLELIIGAASVAPPRKARTHKTLSYSYRKKGPGRIHNNAGARRKLKVTRKPKTTLRAAATSAYDLFFGASSRLGNTLN